MHRRRRSDRSSGGAGLKAGPPPESPDAYVASLTGWQRECVTQLRRAVQSAGAEEVIKWGHLVYLSGGPAFLIRAEDDRVILGFWRGKRLRSIEPLLKQGGKYEMARIDIDEQTNLDLELVTRLAREAVALNQSLGNPTKV